MPNLSLDAARRFWADFHDPMIYRVLTFMEGVERWTLDGDSALETSIDRLGKVLDTLKADRLSDLDPIMNSIITLTANLKATRFLLILQTIDSIRPGSAAKIINRAETDSENGQAAATLFLKRNLVFERLRLMGRIFEKKRFKLMESILEGEEHEIH